MPEGADAVVIQEDTDGRRRSGDGTKAAPAPARAIAGIDFQAGRRPCIPAGTLADSARRRLAAVDQCPWLRVRRRPRVAILATGNEVVLPGEPVGPNQIVSSNASRSPPL